MTTTNPRILPRPGHYVKAQIVRAGLSLRRLAERAGYAPQTLSDYLAGRNRFLRGQVEIWLTFRQLTGSDVSLRQFWGDLLGEEAA